MKRRALGKGLESLLPARPAAATAGGLIELEVDRIVPNPSQPRERFDQSDLEDLAESIRGAGLLQPVLVKEAGSGYELIAGERRWRAAKLAGLGRIPALVQSADEERSLELALIENIQREQLNPIEEARAFAILIDHHGLTQEDVATKLGRKRPTIANTMRLLKLPEAVQDMIRAKTLTSGHAKALLSLEGDSDQLLRAALQMAEAGVSVRDAEDAARRERAKEPRQPDADHADPNVRDAEIRLQRALGTKVRIKARDGKGRIEIEFFSDDELMRLFELLEGKTH